MRRIYRNVRAVTPEGIRPACVIAEDGVIREVCARTDAPADETVDGAGMLLAPGYADVHVHGGGGFSAMSADPADIAGMALAHLRHGVTSVLPTALASPIEKLQKTIAVVSDAMEKYPDLNILGVHLEGPFLSPKKSGAQSGDSLLLPTRERIEALLDYLPVVRMIGAAPELPGGMTVGEEAAKRGITASAAHSDADFSVAEAALAHGYSDVTHIFSACSAMHKEGIFRQVGVAEAGLALDGYTTQFIGDLRHLPAGAIRLIYKAKGADKAYPVSDGLEFAASDMPEGSVVTQENGRQALIEDGVMKLADRSCLAGSVTPLDAMVRNMVQVCRIPLYDALRMASETPLRAIGRAETKGRLAPGCDEDLILLDDGLFVRRVFVKGKEFRV